MTKVIAHRRIEVVSEKDLRTLREFNRLTTKEKLALDSSKGLGWQVHDALACLDISIFKGDTVPLDGDIIKLEDELEFEFIERVGISIDPDHIPSGTVRLTIELD